MADTVTVDIDEMLNNPPSTPSKPIMFRVGDHLRSINPEAYDPEIIAIGPFHHDKPHLQSMEQHKLRYLRLLLQRREEPSVERYVTEIRPFEDRARKCYAEAICPNRADFVKMLILDGCFIIEFLRKFQHPEYRDENDRIFQYVHVVGHLLHDLMVSENQIPFFIIDQLFNMIKINDEDNVESLISPLLGNSILPAQDLPEVPVNGHHLLGIVHDIQCSSFARIFRNVESGDPHNMANINSAVELKEAGISFKKSEGSPQKYVTDYVFLLHCLVHSPEDAKLLRRCGIISNFSGSDEVVYHVINQLGKNIIISNNFSYSNIFCKVKRYCDRPWNLRMATLRRDYFSSPWALISVLAATILLVLAITQTTFAILSFRNDLKGN
ncbi:UPF0481 protein At3g47200-like isoform X2 [Olea europaea var. sylvestris]|uniref:UPF0481 protein At3g47200-like isoform X2 n=1 Tax=Olea europaea var. sylvestris TaxID=158386 RepID=UPI000C1D72E2|nr:UPF0481 protein At3g47200-like isoform X2 [Olea europaea var. sylvestris]